MFGYSEANAVYFSIGDRTGYAKIIVDFNDLEINELGESHYESMIHSGSFQGSPEFKELKANLSSKAKQCHSAEHKTYNAFQKKIKTLDKKTELAQFRNYIPSLEEIKREKDFSVFCGTSFIFSSSMAIIVMCLPNLLKFNNTDPLFMITWLLASIGLMFLSSHLIQKRYLAKPNLLQIFIAQKALKEVLNGNNHKPST